MKIVTQRCEIEKEKCLAKVIIKNSEHFAIHFFSFRNGLSLNLFLMVNYLYVSRIEKQYSHNNISIFIHAMIYSVIVICFFSSSF